MPATPLSQVVVHLRPEDNIAVAARPLGAGAQLSVNGYNLTLANKVGLGHKVALRPIKKGQPVYKYGQIIGFASKDIAPGDHVHVHNVAADAFERDYAFCRDCPPPPVPPGAEAPGSPAQPANRTRTESATCSPPRDAGNAVCACGSSSTPNRTPAICCSPTRLSPPSRWRWRNSARRTRRGSQRKKFSLLALLGLALLRARGQRRIGHDLQDMDVEIEVFIDP